LDHQDIYADLDIENEKLNTFQEEHRYTKIPDYVCPDYPHPVVTTNASNGFMNGAATTYQGVGGAVRAGDPTVSSVHGDLPVNGMFGWGPESARRAADIRDGLTNTLAVGEFVHVDAYLGSGFAEVPGNVRAWIFGANQGDRRGVYAFKVPDHPPNARIDRVADGVPFNYLPHSSYHEAGVNFVMAGGQVRLISNSIDFDLYRGLATIHGGEPVEDFD